MKSKYDGYCYRCYFSIYKGELIRFNGKAFHYDCIQALESDRPRKIDPKAKFARKNSFGLHNSKGRSLKGTTLDYLKKYKLEDIERAKHDR